MAETQVQQGMDLLMTTRDGVEIDYCPPCRGVWLDRGELDKILERGSSQPMNQRYGVDDRQWRRGNFDHNDEREGRGGGWLDNLFDFGRQ
jgi:Zn-finger nucleic acid-binding protein